MPHALAVCLWVQEGRGELSRAGRVFVRVWWLML